MDCGRRLMDAEVVWQIVTQTEEYDLGEVFRVGTELSIADGIEPPTKCAGVNSLLHALSMTGLAARPAHFLATIDIPGVSRLDDAIWLTAMSHVSHLADFTRYYDRSTMRVSLTRMARMLRKMPKEWIEYNWVYIPQGWLIYQGAMIVWPRAKYISVNEERLVHSSRGPAIVLGCGIEGYFIRGAPFPKDEYWRFWRAVTGTDSLIQYPAWRNLEWRRVLFEILGWENALSRLRTQVVQQDERGELLVCQELADDVEGLATFVRVKDASTPREYILRVPPSTRTAAEGVAWTFHITPSGYSPIREA